MLKIFQVIEIFRELAVVAEPVSEKDQGVYLLANLSDSYDMLVTAMDSEVETIPSLETVTEQFMSWAVLESRWDSSEQVSACPWTQCPSCLSFPKCSICPVFRAHGKGLHMVVEAFF